MNIGEVLVTIFDVVRHPIVGKTLRDHLEQTGGRGVYEAVPSRENMPLQFEHVVGGKGTGKFVGIAVHEHKKVISFGDRDDNRAARNWRVHVEIFVATGQDVANQTIDGSDATILQSVANFLESFDAGGHVAMEISADGKLRTTREAPSKAAAIEVLRSEIQD